MRQITLDGMTFQTDGGGGLSVIGSKGDTYAINLEQGMCACAAFRFSKEDPQACKHSLVAVDNREKLIAWRDQDVLALED